MKRALGIGIGLFLTIIGFVEAGFVSRSPADPVPVTLGRAGHLRASRSCSSSSPSSSRPGW